MSDNALESFVDVQEGLSIVKNSMIENVLLVEGKTDAEFYKHFSRIKIHYGSPNETDGIKDIVEHKRIELEQTVYGIIDKDYKEKKEVEREIEKIKDFIFFTDAHSLETMIIRHVGVDDFEKIIRNLLYKCKSINNNFTKDSLKWAFSIGCIRKLIYNKNQMAYDEAKQNNRAPVFVVGVNRFVEKHDFFKAYLIQKENKDYDFNEKAFLNDLVSVSHVKITLKELMSSKRDYKEEDDDNSAWSICRGHDIFDFIDALSRTETKSERYKATVPSWEYRLFNDKKILSKFDNLELKDFFDKINKDNATSNPI